VEVSGAFVYPDPFMWTGHTCFSSLPAYLRDILTQHSAWHPTASHYLKIILDTIFGPQNFRNEIIWKRQSAHSDAKTKFADVTDTILFYAKSREAKFNPQYGLHDPEYVEKFYRFDDHDGRGPYRLDNITSPNPRPNMMYEWLGFAWPQKGWRYQRETMQKLHDEGRIYYPRLKDGTLDTTKRPAVKRYL
jgi:site-specific DNA-methyltransferase (adenine-specific)